MKDARPGRVTKWLFSFRNAPSGHAAWRPVERRSGQRVSVCKRLLRGALEQGRPYQPVDAGDHSRRFRRSMPGERPATTGALCLHACSGLTTNGLIASVTPLDPCSRRRDSDTGRRLTGSARTLLSRASNNPASAWLSITAIVRPRTPTLSLSHRLVLTGGVRSRLIKCEVVSARRTLLAARAGRYRPGRSRERRREQSWTRPTAASRTARGGRCRGSAPCGVTRRNAVMSVLFVAGD